MRVELDRDLCVSSAECLKAAPKAFAHDADGLAYVTDFASATIEDLKLAESRCPTGAIRVIE